MRSQQTQNLNRYKNSALDFTKSSLLKTYKPIKPIETLNVTSWREAAFRQKGGWGVQQHQEQQKYYREPATLLRRLSSGNLQKTSER